MWVTRLLREIQGSISFFFFFLFFNSYQLNKDPYSKHPSTSQGSVSFYIWSYEDFLYFFPPEFVTILQKFEYILDIRKIIHLFMHKLGGTHNFLEAKYHLLIGTCLVKNLLVKQEGIPVQFLGREDSLEEEMATNSINLAWKIPWTEEPGELQSKGSQRVGYD